MVVRYKVGVATIEFETVDQLLEYQKKKSRLDIAEPYEEVEQRKRWRENAERKRELY